MAPSKRLSNGGTPGQQRSISSFFSPGTPSTAKTAKSQRSISSFFSPGNPSASGCQDKKKPVLCIGHLQPPSISPSENHSQSPSKKFPVEKPSKISVSTMGETSIPSSKRLRVETQYALESPCNEHLDYDPETVVGKRLKVYWPMDNAWYEGFVKSYDRITGRHLVLYDDGEEEGLLLANEKIEWAQSEDKISAPSHRFRRLRKLSEKKSEDTITADSVSEILKDVSEPKSPDVVPGTGGPCLGRLKRARVQSKANFNIEEEESTGDDESDEEWGKNSTNVDISDDTDNEEDEELETEEVTRKRKRSQVTIKQAVPRKQNVMKRSPSSHVKLDSPCSLLQGKGEDIAIMASKPLGSVQNNVNGIKLPRQDADNGVHEMQNTVQEKINGSEIHITLTGEAAERFGNRTSEKFKFLCKARRDAAGKRPEDPEYDSRTLLLPPDFLKGLSGGQRQWWEFKSKHMDKVLFFKMGKFYELFEMDAHIGALELDLQYMKGEQPHCGFPEKNFSENVEKLALKGYRVLVVEQTETPDQLEQRRKQTGTKDKVVKREICAVITKGTMTEGGMLATCPDASYLMAVTERCTFSGIGKQVASVIGICVADASTSRFMLGQFSDDSARSRLRAVLSEIRPVELIKPCGILSDETERALMDQTRKALVNNLVPGTEFWDAEKSLIEIKKLYESISDRSNSRNTTTLEAKCVSNHTDGVDHELGSLPDVVCHVVNAGANGQLALSAFGGCLSYLRQVLLDQSLLSFAKLEILPCSDFGSMQDPILKSNQVVFSRDPSFLEPYMTLDAAALENLEILENNHDGSSSGTLLAQTDHCATAFGKRLLRKWLVRPLKRVESILERQDAIADIKGAASDSAMNFRKELARLPDMERLLARVYASSEANGRNANRVILYEDAAKKQLQDFIVALRGCQSMIQACLSFGGSMDQIKSSLLQHLLSPGKGLPDMKPVMKHFEAAFDWSEAEKTGRIVPHVGVNKDYDFANRTVKEIETNLARYLEKQRKHFGNETGINYVTVGKEQYQIEIPETLLAKVPQAYEARSSRKGFRRFWTSEIKELLQELSDAQVQREASLRGILQRLIRQFCEHHSHWREMVHVVAEIDALISLAVASDYFDGPTCRPSIKGTTKLSSEKIDAPHLHAKGLRHPILANSGVGTGSFVPNNVNIGGRAVAPFILLTGPNMGGKSTLLRQVCLAAILAQVGADVPAEEFCLSPVDRVFVRMGAKDHIMAGQSTFLTELSETASMLSSATKDSLVALDELGRGTATSDGQAIAHAVLDHLAHKIGCRGMFSTHYHHLATDYQNDPSVSLYHMACKVGAQVGGLEEVTFLYKLTPGACPKSYGVNVARLAGMPDAILQRAASRSAEFERQYGQRGIECDGRSLGATKSEGKLIQEVLNIVKELHRSGNAAASNIHCLLQVWRKVVSLSATSHSAIKHSSVSSVCDDRPLCSTIQTGF